VITRSPTKGVYHPIEASDHRNACGNQRCPHYEGAQDTPEQDPVLVGGRYGHRAENHGDEKRLSMESDFSRM
jgi:hypothetical protein